MSANLLSQNSRFEYTGEFAGFFRDFFGNSRMVLRISNEELFLGIIKPLYTSLSDRVVPGQEMIVAGNVFPGSRVSQLIDDARILELPTSQRCIRVCSHKKCWRSGGKDIWGELKQHVSEHNLGQSVRLEKSDCLDHCKRGPNLECDGSLFQNCTIRSAMKFLKDLRTPVSVNQHHQAIKPHLPLNHHEHRC
jgi:(2Fe-2S) ferredoxin